LPPWLDPLQAMPDELPYIASKGAQHQVTRSLAVHLVPRAITVDCLDPGPTDTATRRPEKSRGSLRSFPRDVGGP
jgi:3-oxoacyl-[acyl-carrier protein] reductase